MAKQSKSSVFSLRNPGLIMLIIQLLIAAIVFIWFPVQPSALDFALVGWIMVAVYFIWSIQTVIYIYWVEAFEKEASRQVSPDQG